MSQVLSLFHQLFTWLSASLACRASEHMIGVGKFSSQSTCDGGPHPLPCELLAGSYDCFNCEGHLHLFLWIPPASMKGNVPHL